MFTISNRMGHRLGRCPYTGKLGWYEPGRPEIWVMRRNIAETLTRADPQAFIEPWGQ